MDTRSGHCNDGGTEEGETGQEGGLELEGMVSDGVERRRGRG